MMQGISWTSLSGYGRSVLAAGLISLTAGCAGTHSQPESAMSASSSPAGNVLVSVPETDCEIRVWYNYQVVAIPVINERWITTGLTLEERARRAFDTRHRARMNARYMMSSAEEMKALQARDMEKYGNPDGPTFEYLVQKSLNKGVDRDQAYKKIIASSARTDNGYNEECQ
ncbi:hypothetical protein [Oceanospirillum sediminis]|uniref:Uncharacterized protein n=1 Tax=Oceanospirillum sediminis TaxID=2760088 RepID=A0A839IW49_9GAMM|nr:hypothetical protein [Oceanospirillum sediminis]MBB1488679.1 hypothetical protein [Oceanospirillum sediminis]